jgi:hypothetical protein
LFLMYSKGTRTSIADFKAPIEASLGLKYNITLLQPDCHNRS